MVIVCSSFLSDFSKPEPKCGVEGCQIKHLLKSNNIIELVSTLQNLKKNYIPSFENSEDPDQLASEAS